jgi:hypothetical protein
LSKPPVAWYALNNRVSPALKNTLTAYILSQIAYLLYINGSGFPQMTAGIMCQPTLGTCQTFERSARTYWRLAPVMVTAPEKLTCPTTIAE